jgi:tetratricopeptide (TPR) repeat protein
LIKAFYRLQKPWKQLAGIAVILSLVLIGILQTKAVWIGLMVALLSYAAAHVFITIRPKVTWKLNVYVLIAAAILLSNVFFLKVLPSIVDKGRSYNKGVQVEGVNTASRELDDERLMLWQKTYAVFREKPLLGTGMGNWQIWYPKSGLKHLWRAEELNYTFQRPHNDWLWILSETGIIGFNLFLLFLISILAFLLKAAVAVADDPRLQRRLIGYIALMAGYFTAAFFDFPRERMEHTIWINLIFGMAYVEIRHLIPLPSLFSVRPRRGHYLALAAVTGFIVYVGVLRHQGEFTLRKMYAYKVRGKLDQVINLCKAAENFAYTIDPTSIPICWYSGNAKAQNKDFTGAHQDLLKAYRLNPCNRNVLNDLASSYAFRNETEQAKKYYKEAARISPRFDDAKLNLAAVYIREENYKMALYWLHTLNHNSERRTAYETLVKANLR